MRRRDFIAGMAGSAAAWPLATRAQQAKVPTIGFLGLATPSTWSQWVAAFVQRLRELGWIEGRKSVEPMAAVTAPAHVSVQHQKLLHFVGEGKWSDAGPTSAICSRTDVP